MTEILQYLLIGLLIGLLLIHAFRLKSWVINITLILIVSAVLAAELTSMHDVLPFVSILLLLAVNTLLNQEQLSFNGLLALNLCLLIHVISGYISPQNSLLIISLFALTFLAIKIITNQNWLNGLLLLIISLWSLLVEKNDWQTVAYIFGILLLYKQQFDLIKHHKGISSEDLLDQIESAKVTERSRIYQNIHDDVGAELLQMIYELDDDVQRTRVKNVMNKLRQAVSNTAHIHIKADQLLKEICEEILSRCDAAGLKFSHETKLTANPNLSKTRPIHLQRIIRELVNNCLKHSNAKSIHLSSQVADHFIQIILEDDGIGMGTEHTPGKGMRSLRKRVVAEGGEISWLSAENGGTQVVLKVSL